MGSACVVEHTDFESVEISSAPFSLTQFVSWGAPSPAFLKAVEAFSSLAPPQEFGRRTRNNVTSVFLVGTYRWWVLNDAQNDRHIHLDAGDGAVLDLSEGRCMLPVCGSEAVEALRRVTAVDWAALAETGRDDVVLTSIRGNSTCILKNRDDDYTVLATRSLAQNIAEWLAPHRE